MKNILIILILAGAANYAYQEWQQVDRSDRAIPIEAVDDSAAQQNWSAGQQVQGVGMVLRVLSDDNEGSRHQRFILELSSGRTVLVAHNIDLAPRISSLSTGDSVGFYGEFEPNERGGVIHWTHHDPQGRHVGGWLEHKGVRYE
ncbi:MAG: DUF3465 domain-containing protein [Woeseiaceae bacterium]